MFGEWLQTIYVRQRSFTGASAAMLLASGCLLGRIGPLEHLIMGIFGTVGYTLNQTIVFKVLNFYDAGGSTTVHAFGTYFGLTVSFILSKKIRPLHS